MGKRYQVINHKGDILEEEKKPLEQMLIEQGAKPNAGQAAKNYAAFMERWDEICAAYDKGWSYLAIWKALHGEGVFLFSYPAFTGYIRKVKTRQDKTTAGKQAPAPGQLQRKPVGIDRAEIGGDNPRRRPVNC